MLYMHPLLRVYLVMLMKVLGLWLSRVAIQMISTWATLSPTPDAEAEI